MTQSKKVPAWTESAIEAIAEAAAAAEGGFIDNEGCKSLEGHEALQGKTVSMIRGKALDMKIYRAAPKTKAAANGKVVKRKIEYVNALETLAGMPRGSLDSLEKASKPQLEAICAALTKLSDQHNADNE